MASEVKLVGVDVGSTTSSAVIATAQLTRNAVTDRSELTDIREVYRSDMVFTPFNGDALDEIAFVRYLDDWLASGRVDPDQVFGGGALLTGLAAEQANAPVIVRTIRNRLNNALIATADDPDLESWLAFMGSCAHLSRMHPDVPIVNLDIGGGTTNLAFGQAGHVLRTGCLHVGARHIQVTPGGFRIRRLSQHARALLAHLGISKNVGDCLTRSEVDAVLAFYMALLTAAVTGDSELADHRVARLHQVSPLCMPREPGDVVVTVSGGVGSLIYAHLNGQPWPPTTCFGDVGIDLAKMLLRSQWAECFHSFVPHTTGRATVYGLLRHNTEVSGHTIFLPNPEILPLTDIPILGVIASRSTDTEIEHVTALLSKTPGGACLRIDLCDHDGASVRSLAQRLSRILQARKFSAETPLVLLVEKNVGKVFGHYVTAWGALPLNLIVIDEIAERHAQYVRIGRVHQQVVPVSFHGLA